MPSAEISDKIEQVPKWKTLQLSPEETNEKLAEFRKWIRTEPELPQNIGQNQNRKT